MSRFDVALFADALAADLMARATPEVHDLVMGEEAIGLALLTLKSDVENGLARVQAASTNDTIQARAGELHRAVTLRREEILAAARGSTCSPGTRALLGDLLLGVRSTVDSVAKGFRT